MKSKKRGGLGKLLVKHGLYRTDDKGRIMGVSRKGAYTLIFIVLAIGGSLAFLIGLSLNKSILDHPVRYFVSELAVIGLLGIIAAVDYRLHHEGD